ncbi:hypothetical protein [Streptomyces lasiicapitis]|uniref:Integral membrane protein n=1 Tax=Streptomyces lasiicapitis TaxID=1923961 RepID=A0ABQ2LS94_9ACTN|nr:hypothetical protein [Streptomyces lasiicapitis]GGO42559.1 hypothetical protein GCM10012286_24310 [Streptomyces lasiicapitis]
MSTDPFDGHNVMALLGIVFICTVLAASLAAYGCVTFVRRVIRADRQAGATRPLPHALRAAASLAGAGALAAYAWGAAHLLAFDDTERGPACSAAEGPVDVTAIDGYSATYFPLRFGCHTTDGTTYAVGVPDYVNPAALTLTITAAVLAAAAAALKARTARTSLAGTAGAR